MPAELIALVGQAGVTGALIWAGITLHRSAIRAHQLRADDWRATAELHAARADEAVAQLVRLVAPVRDAAGAP